MAESKPTTIDAYIAAAAPAAQPALRRIREIMRRAAPQATESISYRMAALRGQGILIYFGAFKTHIGIFPPVRGDADLEAALAPYRGPKGNLSFPLDQPIPFDLIERIARLHAAQDIAGQKPKRSAR